MRNRFLAAAVLTASILPTTASAAAVKARSLPLWRVSVDASAGPQRIEELPATDFVPGPDESLSEIVVDLAGSDLTEKKGSNPNAIRIDLPPSAMTEDEIFACLDRCVGPQDDGKAGEPAREPADGEPLVEKAKAVARQVRKPS